MVIHASFALCINSNVRKLKSLAMKVFLNSCAGHSEDTTQDVLEFVAHFETTRFWAKMSLLKNNAFLYSFKNALFFILCIWFI